MAEKDKYIPMGGNFYFDPAKRVILRKSGERFVFVRHDRRQANRQVSNERRSQAYAEAAHFRLIQGGLFWDPKAQQVFKKAGEKYLLYSRDRRKVPGKNPAGPERRTAH